MGLAMRKDGPFLLSPTVIALARPVPRSWSSTLPYSPLSRSSKRCSSRFRPSRKKTPKLDSINQLIATVNRTHLSLLISTLPPQVSPSTILRLKDSSYQRLDSLPNPIHRSLLLSVEIVLVTRLARSPTQPPPISHEPPVRAYDHEDRHPSTSKPLHRPPVRRLSRACFKGEARPSSPPPVPPRASVLSTRQA